MGVFAVLIDHDDYNLKKGRKVRPICCGNLESIIMGKITMLYNISYNQETLC